MAGEVHLVPFRTQKLSPRAPMVLRSSPWESRTLLTNKGHLVFRICEISMRASSISARPLFVLFGCDVLALDAGVTMVRLRAYYNGPFGTGLTSKPHVWYG